MIKLRLRQGLVSTLHQHRCSTLIDDCWTVKGLAQELEISRSWLYRRLEAGTLAEPDVLRSPQRGNYLIKNDPVLLARLRAEYAATPNTHAEEGI